MDTYKQIWTTLEYALFSLLCKKSGEKLSQRDLAKLLEVSPTAIAHTLQKLGNLVKIEKTKTIHFVSLNRDERQTIQFKRVVNLQSVYASNLTQYLETELAGATIILFGSYALGEDTQTSDIDLAVVGRKNKPLRLETFEKELNRKINLNFYPSWSKIHEHLKNNILNGIVLQGGVEL